MKSMDTGQMDGSTQRENTMPDGIDELCDEFTEIHKAMVGDYVIM